MKRRPLKIVLFTFLIILCIFGLYLNSKYDVDTVQIKEEAETKFVASEITNHSNDGQTNRVTRKSFSQDNKLVGKQSSANYYCNFPKHEVVERMEEGIAPEGNSEEWELKQVQVIIRHGDRTPLKFNLYKKQDFVPQFCDVFSDNAASYELLKQYRLSISRDYVDLKSKTFSAPLPNNEICGPGQLSSLGVIQHLHNGYMLRSKYTKKLNLVENVSQFVHVRSTLLLRTFQSAIAFLFGLIPDYHLHQVPIERTRSGFFCDSQCYCPFASHYENSVKKRQYKVYVERQKHDATVRKIDATLHIGDHTGGQIDELVTGYLCKNQPLPCNSSGHCITQDDLDHVMDEQEYMNREMYAPPVGRNYALLIIQPLLLQIVGQMEEVISSAKHHKKFILYSGHDTTVAPLLLALGLQEYRWPRLASRLVFELWQKGEQYCVRVLFNGEEVTTQTSFCDQGHEGAPCPFKSMQEFVNTGMAEEMGYATREEACKNVE